MGFKFQKSIKILPGVKFNLGKRGGSLSVGGKGASVNIKPDGTTRGTVGIPGSGLSYSEQITQGQGKNKKGRSVFEKLIIYVGIFIGAIMCILGLIGSLAK